MVIDESYHTVGDLAESIALMLPEPQDEKKDGETLSWFIEKLTSIEKKTDEEK